MSILADYRVLADRNISLPSTGSIQDFSIVLPNNFFQATEHLPLLSFRLDTGIPSNLMFRILTANAIFTAFVIAFTATYNSDVVHSVHEVINIERLRGGVNNTIRFERFGGTGTLDISDIVLFYKRNVNASNLSNTP